LTDLSTYAVNGYALNDWLKKAKTVFSSENYEKDNYSQDEAFFQIKVNGHCFSQKLIIFYPTILIALKKLSNKILT
jgi:hypothetical protein